MEYKEVDYEGNDCRIYKTVCILPIGSKYAVVVLKRSEGGWVNQDNIDTNTAIFDTEKEATEYYDREL
jgi:hypothetical protein